MLSDTTLVQIKTGTTEEWEKTNRILAKGEFGIEITDDNRILVKCGRSNTDTANSRWNTLPYINDYDSLARSISDVAIFNSELDSIKAKVALIDGLKQSIDNVVNGASGLIFKSKSEFPVVGVTNVLYVDISNDCIYRYSEDLGNYVPVSTNEPLSQYPDIYSFPLQGKKGRIYLDESNDVMYRYDEEKLKYFPIGGNIENIRRITCGDSSTVEKPDFVGI